MLTPQMRLCRRWARKSYCTGDPMTQFSHFFLFYCRSVHASMGHASFLRGRGKMQLMNTVFPDTKFDDACIETIPPPYAELHG